MITSLARKIFGSRNERILKEFGRKVEKINELEAEFQHLTDSELQAKTAIFKERLASGESLDSILPEAFATVREAASRTLSLRHFDVQLMGGMVLHHGKIAEMRTGEGKTLVATLPVYLNALTGKSVHIVTVNDYLARRDAEWMRPIYNFLGLEVGINVGSMSREEKQKAYRADVTYGTNNEFGFDYLRDNMVFSTQEKVQRDLTFAIVDEVDSILIDEARTPLIISGQAEDSSELYIALNNIIPQLTKQEQEEGAGDFSVDEKSKQAFLTEQGHQTVEELMVKNGLLKAGESLYSPKNLSLVHHLNAALRAHALFTKDVDYIVQNNEVVIVDEHTGRTMPGRRWSDGLHQAVEAKEKVSIQSENQTLASITFQNYFRLYEKLAGMTGTADTEAYEFQQIYGLEVIVIPTNKPMMREDQADLIFATQEEKFAAIIEDIKDCQQRQQPVLVGTASIETSEYLSKLLQKEKIQHQVLNAKFHDKEAQIIADAGIPGTVTIATNMAGRGTDIVLGGNLESQLAKLGDDLNEEKKQSAISQWRERHQQVLNAGGLRIIGSERHESRRIDNQLRGRSGRQGDPGSSRFYLSLKDNLMRIFASDRVTAIMQKFGLRDGEAIEHPWITRAIENAQRKVEGYNFDVRKQLLEYDDIANEQRRLVYADRSQLMAAEDISGNIEKIWPEAIDDMIEPYIPTDSIEDQWDVNAAEKSLESELGLPFPIAQWLKQDEHFNDANIRQRVADESFNAYQQKLSVLPVEAQHHFPKSIFLQTLDYHWKEHLAAMDYLRQGIHLRGYAQKNPKQEYKREAFNLFKDMLTALRQEVVSTLSKVQIQVQQVPDDEQQQSRQTHHQNLQFQHAQADNVLMNEEDNAEDAHQPFVRENRKVGRNEACPCGSGRKYKQCHGKLSAP